MTHPSPLSDHSLQQAANEFSTVILPWWWENGIDRERGGFFTCWDNRGQRLASEDKYTWSQGRFVWLLARAANLARSGVLDLDVSADDLVEAAQRGAEFVLQHALLDDDTCHFAVAGDGTPLDQPRSVYADLFVVMGMAELGAATNDDHWTRSIVGLARRASQEISEGTAPTPPYAVPAGHRAFGPQMILANTVWEIASSLERQGRQQGDVLQGLRRCVTTMLAHRQPSGDFAELMPTDPADPLESLVARHRVPGHALEGLWVALLSDELLASHGAERTSGPSTEEMLDSIGVLCEQGWDHEVGGLLHYVDRDGGEPQGSTVGTEYEALVQRTWDTKLWWIHTEASYVTALAAQRHGHELSARWHQRIWDYTMETFPGRDQGAEWIQIRERDGEPLDTVVALPVKDPFHISRNLMQLAELRGSAS
ncbi:AGE family epimerase/isomerase [Parenemella sanctibonifatiensis]|uniref:N-acylglucosamine 2-epimerase n=1 Tax=Parenemella sanctibonifatiensis TaxID=2016505 RepID=A0A255EAI2_9ACTN|nr:AGE family epimerase/isomerase [Parenemella sanctibonifatiensis]OYN86412.1 N-acylglucosamine 2-epimerase [Parenemella sanctibonifatiensis]